MTCVLAGGGLSHCGAYGETDELSKTIVKDPVSVPDFFATVCAAMGVDAGKYLYDGDRPCLSLIMANPSINFYLNIPKIYLPNRDIRIEIYFQSNHKV